MKLLITLFALIIVSTSYSTEISNNTPNGQITTIKSGDKFKLMNGHIIQCEVPACTIRFQYVGKKYIISLPNGKDHSNYPSEDEALAKVQTLVNAKVCERTILAHK